MAGARQLRRGARAMVASLLLLGGAAAAAAAAEPPAATAGAAAAAPAAGDAQVSEVKGGFFASLKQAFSQDPEREVVLGHFDVGKPPDAHRFYCLIDPKTGKKEPNAVGGEPVRRRDGMTGIKSPAVSPLSCADAEQKGLLVTTGYVLKGAAAGSSAAGATLAQKSAVAPGAVPAGAGSPAAGPAPAPQPTPAPVPPAAMPAEQAVAPIAGDALQTEVMAAFTRFIAAQNAHDRAGVGAALLDSPDFVWVRPEGTAVWGSTEALTAFTQEWQGTWKLDPQTQELRLAAPAPGVAVLVTPLLLTAGDPGRYPSTLPVRWAEVLVKTASGWRIAAIFTTPLPSRQTTSGG